MLWSQLSRSCMDMFLPHSMHLFTDVLQYRCSNWMRFANIHLHFSMIFLRCAWFRSSDICWWIAFQKIQDETHSIWTIWSAKSSFRECKTIHLFGYSSLSSSMQDGIGLTLAAHLPFSCGTKNNKRLHSEWFYLKKKKRAKKNANNQTQKKQAEKCVKKRSGKGTQKYIIFFLYICFGHVILKNVFLLVISKIPITTDMVSSV